MPELALILACVYWGLAFFGRIALQYARTGSSGLVMATSRSPVEALVGLLLFGGGIGMMVAAGFQAADELESVAALDGSGGHVAGIALWAFGLVVTLAAQLAMGNAWRIGVDESERTDLVTSGPFAIVRNPIYSGMIPAGLGIALLAANPVTLVCWAALFASLQIQTRLVEEPHLLRVHGEAYASYAARVGRFVPAIGRLR